MSCSMPFPSFRIIHSQRDLTACPLASGQAELSTHWRNVSPKWNTKVARTHNLEIRKQMVVLRENVQEGSLGISSQSWESEILPDPLIEVCYQPQCCCPEVLKEVCHRHGHGRLWTPGGSPSEPDGGNIPLRIAVTLRSSVRAVQTSECMINRVAMEIVNFSAVSQSSIFCRPEACSTFLRHAGSRVRRRGWDSQEEELRWFGYLSLYSHQPICALYR